MSLIKRAGLKATQRTKVLVKRGVNTLPWIQEMIQELENTRQTLKGSQQNLRKTRQRKDKEIAELKTELAQRDADVKDYGVKPENVVWIFGGARTGSTWLSDMMDEITDHAKWNEPLVGAMLGYFYYKRAGHRIDKGGKNFILGQRYEKIWQDPVRTLILGGAAARFPELAKKRRPGDQGA